MHRLLYLRGLTLVLLLSACLSRTAAGQSFAPTKIEYSTGARPYSIVVVDVNGDGRPDLMTANQDASNASVRLASGAPGGFATTVADFATGSLPRSIAVVDVNADNRPDLITADYNSNTVSVRLASGAAGSFAATKSDYATGTGPQHVAVVDVNGDGRPDLLTANSGPGNASVRLASGVPGSFATTKTDYAAGAGSMSVAVADVNADGRPDLITANSNADQVSVRLASGGAGSFAATKTDYATDAGPRSIAVVDVNADGRPDLITANFTAGNVSVRLASGQVGEFATARTDYATGAGPQSVAVGDVNTDGRPDLITANFTAGNASVRLASGAAGSFAATKVDYVTGSNPCSVAVADVDADGRPDLVTANSGTSNVSVRLNTTPVPLPVELVSFVVEVQGVGALVRWATASEKNNDRFEVEASTDGHVFTRRGTVAGSGSSLQPRAYQFIDEPLGRYAAPVVYYRLRQVDAGGTSQYSPVRAVAVPPDAAVPPLVVYPTLAEAGQPLRYTCRSSYLTMEARLEVYDAAGRRMSQQLATASGVLEIKDLSPGWYWVRLVTARGSAQALFYRS